MAFQFQAIAALSPFLVDELGIGLADLGFLIALYLAPGVVFAIPGGAIGRYIGDQWAVCLGLVMMLVGAIVIVVVPIWEAQILGRLIAGIGGNILNVLMSKMVADWLADKELATAMGIFVNSWPVGIAAALLFLPIVADGFGSEVALILVGIMVALALLAMATLYVSPQAVTTAPRSSHRTLGRAAWLCILASGTIWGLYNAALSMVFAFGPIMLAERGWSALDASAATSIVLWIVALSIPIGGIVADRLDRPNWVLGGGLSMFSGLLILSTVTEQIIPVFILLGLVSGLPAGVIMSLPSRVLKPDNRAFGMGAFLTLYYVALFVAPAFAGHMAEFLGSAEFAFTLGGLMLLACLPLMAVYYWFVPSPRPNP